MLYTFSPAIHLVLEWFNRGKYEGENNGYQLMHLKK